MADRDIVVTVTPAFDGRLGAPARRTPQETLARVRALMVARYKLHQVGAKAHELVRADGVGVSTGYCGGEVRFRLMRGGVWVVLFDVPITKLIPSNRAQRLDPMTLLTLDSHFGTTSKYAVAPEQGEV